ncbi:PREDICTED: synaptojanin-2-binding protein [Poecilia mexicana]|uniref:Synaptojanin-2-binding protein n=1 Tax=Poecilia mexicana TaxID=48701 RepID=A0A3B3XG49_9TELE|nr:PREDICTED: synaptojanin-2-binding protein [Poecilia mexicana]
MNGSLHSRPRLVDINLNRGPAGLGFNIIGGIDQQFVRNDNGVYVSKIKEGGSAALDGRLEEGDKILAINGVSLENRYHSDVVELFRSAGENVHLRVMKKSDLSNGPSTSKPDRQPSSSTLGMLALFAGAVSIIVIVALYKRLK